MSPSQSDEPTPGGVAGRERSGRENGTAPEAWLRRLTIAGIVLPVAFIVGLQLLRAHVVDPWWPHSGDVFVSLLTALAAVAFGVVMFAIIGRGHRQVVRRNQELAVINDLLLLMAGDSDGGRVRTAAIDEARVLLGAREAGIAPCGTQIEPGRDNPHVLSSNLRGPESEVLWVARDTASGRFDSTDQRTLHRMADLVSVAQERDRLRDAERNAAIVTERLRISREMHDSLAQVLAVAHLRLRALAARSDVPEQVIEQMSDIADVCEEAYGDVRETIHGLREAAREDRDCVEAMRGYVEWFARQSGIEASFHAAPAAPRLSGHVAVHTLRVMQEALTNVRKHSGAGTVMVTVGSAAPELASAGVDDPGGEMARLVVHDDGRGFDPCSVAPSEHYGLRSMRERAEAIGGRLLLESGHGHGTRVVMDIPCPPGTRASADTPAERSENTENTENSENTEAEGTNGPVPGTEPAGRVRA